MNAPLRRDDDALDTDRDLTPLDADDLAPTDPNAVPDMTENFGLDAEPGTKGVKAFGAGLSGDIGGNTARSSSDPDTYRDAPSSGAKTGGGGV